jgi:hypothetical protein
MKQLKHRLDKFNQGAIYSNFFLKKHIQLYLAEGGLRNFFILGLGKVLIAEK